MNNATLETMTAERDSLRAAFIRYIALDQFIGCEIGRASCRERV